MDPKPEIPRDEVEALIRRADSARTLLADGMQVLRYKADVPARIKDQFRAHPMIWFGAASVCGLLISRLVFRRGASAAPTSRKSRGIKGLVISALFAVAKPAIKSIILNEAKKRLSPMLAKSQAFSRKAPNNPDFP